MINNVDNLNGNIRMFHFASKIEHSFKMSRGIAK